MQQFGAVPGRLGGRFFDQMAVVENIDAVGKAHRRRTDRCRGRAGAP